MLQLELSPFSDEKFNDKDIFNLITLKECLKEGNFASLIAKWIQEWNSVVFFPFISPHRDDLLVITHSRTSEAHLDGKCEGSTINTPTNALISIFLIEFNSITPMSPYTSTVFIRWLFSRRDTEYADFIDIIRSNGIISIIQSVCHNRNIDFSQISTVYLLFPCVREIELLIPCFPSEAWTFQKSYAAERIKDNANGSTHYRHIYHMIWQNPHFKSEEIPPFIRKKMQGALALYYWLHPNPNLLPSENKIEMPIEIYNLAQQYHIIQKKIRIQLNRFRRWQKLIWGSLVFSFPFRPFVRRFADRVKWILFLMQYFGFRIRYCEINSSNALNFFRDNRDALLMTLIECVPTEGSPFFFLVDDNGNFNVDLLNPEILKQWFGSYIGVLEFNLNLNQKASNKDQWIYAGTIYGRLRERPSPYIRSLFATILLPKLFRGYGLGGMLIQICTHILESLDYCDEVVDASTENNHAMKFLMKRFCFFKYGNISNSIYNIKALFDKSQPFTLGLQRMTWYSKTILDFLAKRETDPQLKKSFANAYQIMTLLVPHVRKFHDRGVLIKFE